MRTRGRPVTSPAAPPDGRASADAGRATPAHATLEPADAASIFAALGEAAYVWDLGSDTLRWSANAPDLLGVEGPAHIATGRAFAALLDPTSPTNRYDAVIGSAQRDQGQGVPYQLCYSLHPPESENVRWVEDSGRWFAGPDGRPAHAAGAVRIVTDRYLREERLMQLSAIDSLTGGMNRSRLCDEIEQALHRGERQHSSFGFLLVGIDGLGRLNRTYGFDVADQAIGVIAQRLNARMRASDALGRFSSSKFGIVLHECGPDDIGVAAARFINAVRESPIETSAGPIGVSVTAGGVIAPRHARTLVEVMGHAQEALDLARARGRGSFKAYLPTVESEARRRENLRLTDVIVSALNDRRVSVAMQPVVRAQSRELAFHECLARICDVDGSEIDALSILTVAEKLDLVRLIDHRVLELAAAALHADPALRVSLNVSAATVHDPVWMAAFSAEMRAGLGPRVIVEITESAAIRDVESARRFVARVKSYGCRVAIDDFGAGYTSFRNLRRLGVDLVKIDGSFVTSLEHSPDDRAFVRALLELAHALGLETVAEWVQTETAAAALIGWGCEYLQGALVGLPQPVPAAEPERRSEAAAG